MFIKFVGKGTSDFAILDLPEDNRIKVYADELIDFSEVVRMNGNVKVETSER